MFWGFQLIFQKSSQATVCILVSCVRHRSRAGLQVLTLAWLLVVLKIKMLEVFILE